MSKWKHRCLSLQRGAHCRRSFHPWPVCKKLYFLIFSFFEILVSTVGSHRKNNEVSCTTANNEQQQTNANGDVIKGEGNKETPPRGSRRAGTRQMRSPLGEEGVLVRCVTRGQSPLRSPERRAKPKPRPSGCRRRSAAWLRLCGGRRTPSASTQLGAAPGSSPPHRSRASLNIA